MTDYYDEFIKKFGARPGAGGKLPFSDDPDERAAQHCYEALWEGYLHGLQIGRILEREIPCQSD
jgi:hypothetical protein